MILDELTVELSMSQKDDRAYVLVIIDPGKEQNFANEILTKGLDLDSKVERMDFVHGSFDFIITLRGSKEEIDLKILEIRKTPYVRRTETLIPFEMFNWEDLANKEAYT